MQMFSLLQKHYNVHNNERERAAQSMCKLCEKLNEERIETKSYDTLGDWWWGGGKCKNKVKQQKIIFDPPVSVLFRAMFHGIDQSQNGVRKFFNFFHQDED